MLANIYYPVEVYAPFGPCLLLATLSNFLGLLLEFALPWPEPPIMSFKMS